MTGATLTGDFEMDGVVLSNCTWTKNSIKGGVMKGGTIRGGVLSGGKIEGGSIKGGELSGGIVSGGNILQTVHC